MRTAFHHQLDALSQSIADMCDRSGTAMAQATEALLGSDIVLAETVISAHHGFIVQVNHAETTAYNLLLLQAPVASDLRAVLASLKNVADVYRMAALALQVADTVRLRHPSPTILDDIVPHFAKMGRIAVDLSRDATEVVLSGTDHAVRIAYDDAMDELHWLVFAIVMDRQWSHTVYHRRRYHPAEPLLRAVRRPCRDGGATSPLPGHRFPRPPQ